MIILRQKIYNATWEKFGKVMKDNPIIPVASIGLSATSVGLSAKRNKQLKEQNQKQLEAMEHLTRSLGQVNKTMKETTKVTANSGEEKKSSVFPFYKKK